MNRIKRFASFHRSEIIGYVITPAVMVGAFLCIATYYARHDPADIPTTFTEIH